MEAWGQHGNQEHSDPGWKGWAQGGIPVLVSPTPPPLLIHSGFSDSREQLLAKVLVMDLGVSSVWGPGDLKDFSCIYLSLA